MKLGHADNMHRTWEYSVKDTLKQTDNILSVYFYSPTKFIADAFAKAPTRGTEDAMNGFVHIRKLTACLAGTGAHIFQMQEYGGRSACLALIPHG